MHRHDRTVDPPLLFLDLETGGLDANRDEILEVGAVVTTPDGAHELGRIDARVRPLRPEQISDVARDINGRTLGYRPPAPTALDAAETTVHPAVGLGSTVALTLADRTATALVAGGGVVHLTAFAAAAA